MQIIQSSKEWPKEKVEKTNCTEPDSEKEVEGLAKISLLTIRKQTIVDQS